MSLDARNHTTPASAEAERVRIAGIYDRMAPQWDACAGRSERWLVGAEFRERLAELQTGDVLEIGVGTGPTLRQLAHRDDLRSFTGIDLSAGMLAEAERVATTCRFPVRLLPMDAEDLSVFPDASFDTVTTSLVLCTVPDPARALREMARVCRPDGRLVLLEHVLSRNPVVGLAQKVVAPLQARQLGCHLDRTTDRLVRELGFTVEHDDSRLFGIFHLMVLHAPQR